MIKTLYISNYALISELSIEFGQGLNIITGETGAGKSIILGALSLLLGGRAETRSVRDASRKTVVEAVFDITGYPEISTSLSEADIDTIDNGECILRREITTKGGSRAFINDTPVNLTVLKSIGSRLVDIHSQHDNLLLVDADYQITVIDALADNAEILERYHEAYRTYRARLKEYTRTLESIKQSRAENEFLAHQLAGLDRLALRDGETAQLEHDRDIVANATEIKTHLEQAIDSLSRGENDPTALIARAEVALGRVGDFVDDVESLVSRLESARIELADIADTLDEYNRTLSADPAELEAIETRLGEIYSLKNRFGVTTDAELIARAEDIRRRLDIVENSETIIADLEERARRAKRDAVTIARTLSERRAEAAKRLSSELAERAMPMGLTNLRVDIRLTTGKLGTDGADTVDFLFAFNKNQPLTAVGRTASGGEISRLVLALKSIVVERINLPTVIFDEVDTGVSGDVANRMAALMTMIAKTTQVITITHLPTVAAHGQRHFKVYKRDEDDTTNVHIKQLSDAERRGELALMISGDADDAAALASAAKLLNNSK